MLFSIWLINELFLKHACWLVLLVQEEAFPDACPAVDVRPKAYKRGEGQLMQLCGHGRDLRVKSLTQPYYHHECAMNSCEVREMLQSYML